VSRIVSIPLLVIALISASSSWARDSEKTTWNYKTFARRIAVPTPTSTPMPTPTPTQTTIPTLIAPNPLNASTTANRVLLSWTNVSSETGFLVERRRYNTPSFSEIAKTMADTLSYTDILTTADYYEYRVRAYSATRSLNYSPYTNIAHSTLPCE
jgi:hypothetical protein